MKTLTAITFCAVAFLATAVSAQGTVFKITKPGYYQLVNGKLVPIQVVDVDAPTTPDPTPTPDPTTPPVDPVPAVRQAIAGSLAKVTEPTKVTDASDLSKIVKALADETKKPSPTITRDQVLTGWGVVGTAYTISKPSWKDFVTIVGDLVGKAATLSAIGDVLTVTAEELGKVK